jgi:hypothetical protein
LSDCDNTSKNKENNSDPVNEIKLNNNNCNNTKQNSIKCEVD